MSSSNGLYYWQSKPLIPVCSFRELVQRDEGSDKPEYTWLATLLEDRPDLLPRDAKTEASVFDVNSDGRVSDPRYGPLPDRTYASKWLKSSRKPDDRVRIVYIGIENEDVFDTTIIDALAMEHNLHPAFFFDHFLPSLWSDRRIAFNNQPLSWVPPVPSEHRYLRFKDCEGRNISAAFVCTDMAGAGKTVIILGPIEARTQPPQDYKFQLCNFGKRHEGLPSPTMYNGSEYLYPVLHLLNKEYSHFLHNLKLQALNENNIVAHRRRVVATEERLRYCLHNLTVLGDDKNPETMDVERYIRHLIDLTKQLKEDADDWLEKETRMQNKEAAEKNLKTAIEAIDEARASRELAKSVWRLTLLAFIFVPLNFVTSAFAMHLQLLGFHESEGGLPTWSFFAVAVPMELLALFLFGIMSGYLAKSWRGCGHVMRGILGKPRRDSGTNVSSGGAAYELQDAADRA